ncbi:O-acetyl-ADP-ribose deacetylase [Methylohalobius crimeensis]|uniref:O-acetyl-ADP-ribose deacetylase n=1 Tax=Methylohalobius crimeensis TaxID=244365 RepID=UPI0003B4B633|nr:O-acetyl-ADP-ribose deacetylase [Methylohalobius crimeensis]
MPSNQRIEAIRADITQLEVDAIVNAANRSLLGGGGVDGAIHRAAGPRLLEACRKLGGCPTGKAKATPGFNLPAKYVLHAVGPVWHGGDRGEDELLASCYRECMRLAREYDVRTLAFPAISCGVYGFPLERAAPIAIRTLTEALDANPRIEKVYLVGFDETVRHTYEDYLSQLRESDD